MNTIINNLNPYFTHGFIGSLFNIVILLILAYIINRVTSYYINRRETGKTHFLTRIKNLFLFLLIGAGILSQFESMQSISNALLASSGIIAIVLGLAGQEAASNLINGMMIIIYHPYKIGDFIRLNDYQIKGYVIDITMRHTLIKTIENTNLYVPNSITNKAIVENVNERPEPLITPVYINVDTDSDVELVKRLIIEETLKSPLFIDSRSKKDKANGYSLPMIFFIGLDNGCFKFKVNIGTKDAYDATLLESHLRERLSFRFKENGIKVPITQINITNQKDNAK